MNNAVLIRVFACILILATFFYAYLRKQNAITKLRLEVPQEAKVLEEIVQENSRLQFEIDQFENPGRLMELARKPEYRHLKHPMLKDIVEIKVKKQ